MRYVFFILSIFVLNSCVTKSENKISREKVEQKIESNRESIEVENNESDHKQDQVDDGIQELEKQGDKASNLYNKYIYYIKAYKLADQENINEIERLEIKIAEVKESLDITVVVNSDIDNDLSTNVRKYITSKGYIVSDIGYLTVLIELNTKDVELENEYYNKFWNLTVSLKDAKDNIVESNSYSGRESQISADYLDGIILKEVEKRVNMSLKDILP